MHFIADATAEILKYKNCGVSFLFFFQTVQSGQSEEDNELCNKTMVRLCGNFIGLVLLCPCSYTSTACNVLFNVLFAEWQTSTFFRICVNIEFMFSLWESHSVVKLWRNFGVEPEDQNANSDDTIFIYFVPTGVMTQMCWCIARESLRHTLAIHRPNMYFIADATNEIL